MAENAKPKTDYQSNSVNKAAAKAEGPATPRVQQVATARMAKPTLGSKFREAFVGQSGQSVGSYVMFDILIPRFKELLFEVINGGSGYALFGNGGQRGGRGPRSQLVDKTNYSGMSSRSGVRDNRQVSAQDRATHRFDDIVIDDRGEAERALDILRACLDQYDQATVADFFDAIGVSREHTDLKFGWTNLDTARIIPARGGGYIVDLPQTEVL